MTHREILLFTGPGGVYLFICLSHILKKKKNQVKNSNTKLMVFVVNSVKQYNWFITIDHGIIIT